MINILEQIIVILWASPGPPCCAPGRAPRLAAGCIYIYIYTYVYTYVCTYIYIYIYIYICLSLSLSIYIYIYVYIHVYIYIYILINTSRRVSADPSFGAPPLSLAEGKTHTPSSQDNIFHHNIISKDCVAKKPFVDR